MQEARPPVCDREPLQPAVWGAHPWQVEQQPLEEHPYETQKSPRVAEVAYGGRQVGV